MFKYIVLIEFETQVFKVLVIVASNCDFEILESHRSKLVHSRDIDFIIVAQFFVYVLLIYDELLLIKLLIICIYKG